MRCNREVSFSTRSTPKGRKLTPRKVQAEVQFLGQVVVHDQAIMVLLGQSAGCSN